LSFKTAKRPHPIEKILPLKLLAYRCCNSGAEPAG
jgi:hypothetical protein